MLEWRGVDEISTEAGPTTAVTNPDGMGRAGEAVTPAKVSAAQLADPWKTWTKKRKIGRLKVSRSIEDKVVWNLTSAW